MSHSIFSPVSLAQLGWRPFHSQQLTLNDLDGAYPARVLSAHRSNLIVLSAQGTVMLSVPPRSTEPNQLPVTVGDWVLVDSEAPRVQRVITPYSVLARPAAGSDHRLQAIAANLDTLFVVTSCNDDFNLSRLERYLAVAFDAHVEPVVVITKTDLCDDVEPFVDQARSLRANTAIVTVNATQADSAERLGPWLQQGQTVAFVGSSGVGKSTLVNTLVGNPSQVTAAIREDDSRGRHTTTAREMFALAGGAWVIDTPGMRELKIGAIESGLRTVFDNIEALAPQCRFRDCRHESEDGCAVLAAVMDGRLEARRLVNYHKLRREAAHAAMTTQERRERDKRVGRVHASALRALYKKRRE